MTPAQRALRSRIGGLTTAARHDPRAYTAPARAAFSAKFYVGIPEGLPEHERDRRAEAAKRAHMTSIALRSVQARAARRSARNRRRSAQLEQVVDEPDLVLVGEARQGSAHDADPSSQPVATDGQAQQLGRQLSLVRPRHGTSVAQVTTRRTGPVTDRDSSDPVEPTGPRDRRRAPSVARRRSTGIGST